MRFLAVGPHLRMRTPRLWLGPHLRMRTPLPRRCDALKKVRRTGRASQCPALSPYFLSNHSDNTTSAVDPSSISVEMAFTSGVTPNLIIE